MFLFFSLPASIMVHSQIFFLSISFSFCRRATLSPIPAEDGSMDSSRTSTFLQQKEKMKPLLSPHRKTHLHHPKTRRMLDKTQKRMSLRIASLKAMIQEKLSTKIFLWIPPLLPPEAQECVHLLVDCYKCQTDKLWHED